MATPTALLEAIPQLDYRVTPGDVATKTGLDLQVAQQSLVTLAADAGGHLQVSESGDIAYVFPPNFRTIQRNKYWQIRAQEIAGKIWRGIFYLIRISFGILLILSVVIIAIAILAMIIAISYSSRSSSDNRGGSSISFPRIMVIPNFGRLFSPSYYHRSSRPGRRKSKPVQQRGEMSFLESVFSFLFGDGDPNDDLEERRWRTIGQIIRQHRGAVVAEQIAPYWDRVDEDEDFMLSVLARFNGYPEVSELGALVYYFPDLQVTAQEEGEDHYWEESQYLREEPWQFSRATQGQQTLALGLGLLNLGGALGLGYLLLSQRAIAFELFVRTLGIAWPAVWGIYGVLFAYGLGFLLIPGVRSLWLKARNPKLEQRNQERCDRAQRLTNPSPELTAKLQYAQTFATQKVLGRENLIYTTETDLLDQELSQSDRIDAEWRKRLEGE
ncbi:hypothetical protein VB712_16195 [Spirulina sp. CCNP1310]|uniref:hypothetical protein n=1 Tax=Spirulina sp. CCNP1310 TaxID=3110249 RepID=UPI002B1FE01F|nr:hypothetical protein [Spirulina sp. CCNP1310]MEA5420774.1 hypothetical protein [Spirulina sp. CCNP1310]